MKKRLDEREEAEQIGVHVKDQRFNISKTATLRVNEFQLSLFRGIGFSPHRDYISLLRENSMSLFEKSLSMHNSIWMIDF